jgi:DNA (cytosine-5)-methyltransferase 1
VNYYNEFDSFAAQWLRNLIDAGLIPAGDVDERSIEDVSPVELMGYEQCHFFAGIGGWSLALQLAGWTGPAWTGSCPCQPFSAAGKRLGTADERHLWPVFARLIAQCKPAAVFGEQVASKAGRQWLSGVRADLEALGYGVGAADLCAAGVGAPHIRQRLYWVADANAAGPQPLPGPHYHDAERHLESRSGVGNTERGGCESRPISENQPASGPESAGGTGGLGNPQHAGLEGHPGHGAGAAGWAIKDRPAAQAGSNSWSDSIWIPCADGKARRIEPGLVPLVDGFPRGVVPSVDPCTPGYAEETAEARVMRLRGYGNAIVPQLAAEFISAYMEAAV